MWRGKCARAAPTPMAHSAASGDGTFQSCPPARGPKEQAWPRHNEQGATAKSREHKEVAQDEPDGPKQRSTASPPEQQQTTKKGQPNSMLTAAGDRGRPVELPRKERAASNVSPRSKNKNRKCSTRRGVERQGRKPGDDRRILTRKAARRCMSLCYAPYNSMVFSLV